MTIRFAAVSALLLAASSASASIIDVTSFNSADWTHSIYQFGIYGGSGVGMPTSTGNPSDGWLIENSCGAYYSGAWNSFVFNNFTYNPSVGGPLSDLSFSIDSAYYDHLQALSFVIEQGGDLWRVAYWVNTPTWTTYAVDVDFGLNTVPMNDTQPVLPDFSASGAPIRFGFGSANSSASGWGYNATGYYDNFQVNFIPSPGAVALVAFSGLVAKRRRR